MSTWPTLSPLLAFSSNAPVMGQIVPPPNLPKSYVKVLSPKGRECDLIWKQGWSRCHKGGPSSNMTCVLIKREYLDTETHIGRSPREEKSGEDKPRRDAWSRLPLNSLKKEAVLLTDTLISDFQPQNWETANPWRWHHLVVVLCWILSSNSPLLNVLSEAYAGHSFKLGTAFPLFLARTLSPWSNSVFLSLLHLSPTILYNLHDYDVCGFLRVPLTRM